MGIRVAAVDDRPQELELLQRWLRVDPSLVWKASWEDAQQALEALHGDSPRRLREADYPEVLLCDVRMPQMSGPELILALRRVDRKLKILAVSQSEAPADILAARAAGADGYLFNCSGGKELSQAIWDVLTVGTHLSPRVQEKLWRPCLAFTAMLSPREEQILGLLRMGLSTKLIAARIGTSSNNIEAFKKSMFRKLGVNSALEAVAVA